MKEQDLLENYISDLQKNERRLIPEQKKNNYSKSNRKYDKTYKSIVKFKIDKFESDMPDKHSQITSHNHISDKDTITTMVKNYRPLQFRCTNGTTYIFRHITILLRKTIN